MAEDDNRDDDKVTLARQIFGKVAGISWRNPLEPNNVHEAERENSRRVTRKQERTALLARTDVRSQVR